MRKLVKGIAALLLSGMLSVGSVSGSVYAAAVDVDSDLTSEIAEKVFTEEPAETSEAPAESVRASEIEEEVLPEEVPQEETVTSYTVTLDANGGCFADEWDDSIGDYVEQAEVVEKQIPAGGTVTAVPVYADRDGRSLVFAGWSTERDGEPVSTGDGEYAPAGNCVLYAVWKIVAEPEEESRGEADESVDESTELMDIAQESEAAEEAEDAEDAAAGEESPAEGGTDSDPFTIPETEEDPAIIPDRKAIYADENEEKSDSDSFDTIAAEEEADYITIDSADSEEGIVESGNCGQGISWTLDSEGTLVISGHGEMGGFTDYPDGSRIKNIVISEGITSISQGAFMACEVQSVSIASSVIKIGDYAFSRCAGLENVTLSIGLKEIGGSAFAWTGLRSITIPSNVEK